MIRLKRSSIVLLSVVAVAFVAAMGYVVVAGYGKSSVLEDMIAQEAAQEAAEAESPSAPSESADKATESLARVGDTQTVASARFAMDILPGWSVRGFDDESRLSDGTTTYGWVYNTVADEMTDPDVVQIQIKDALKEGKTFDEVVSALAWDDADVREIVAFMSEEAAEAFPDYSEEDVSVSMTYDEIGGSLAARNMLQCQKPCYIEGAAQTNVIYFVDAPDRVYLLVVSTNTQSTTADFLNAADAVIRTFRFN